MSPEETHRALRRVHLFRDLSDEDVETLAKNCRERGIAKGEVVVDQGSKGDELHVILEGAFEVFLTQSALSFEKPIGELGPGEYFGEIALVTGKERSASVRALSDGKLLSLARKEFLGLCERSPQFTLKLCQALADYVQAGARQQSTVPYLKLAEFDPDRETLDLIPDEVSKLCEAVAVDRDNEFATIVMVDPDNAKKRDFLAQALKPLRPHFAATSADEMARFVDRVAASRGYRAKPPAAVNLDFRGPDGQPVDISQNDAAKILRDAFREAVTLKASDVHFEPKRDGMDIRARVDGRLLPLRDDIPGRVVKQVISMIKVLGNLDIAEKRLPQDGNFSIEADDLEIDARLSVMPSQHGEKAVTRLLDPRAQLHYLNQIISSEPVLALANELFTRAAGLTLVTGPTGSGKTTTLYAGLRSIWENNRLLNIVSAEDPIDQRLDFATQTQIRDAVGLTFPKVLRGLLRQDPDVILIGEIRDETSAAIALEAAITGHSVLSSLHTKYSAESVARLRKLGAEPYLIAAALNGVISQRLLPRLNPHALEAIPADDDEIHRLKRIGVLDEPSDQLRRGRENLPEIGRVGLFEILSVDDGVRDAIETTATTQQLEQRLNPRNFVSMKRYARYLLLQRYVAPASVLTVFPEAPEVDQI